MVSLPVFPQLATDLSWPPPTVACDSNAIGKMKGLYLHIATALELQSVLFGASTLAIMVYLYWTLRFRPARGSWLETLARLLALLLPYILFMGAWVLSIRNAADFSSIINIGCYRELNGQAVSNYKPLIAESALFGLFCALIGLAAYVHARKGPHSRSQQAMLAIALVMYAVSFAHWAFEMCNFQTAIPTLSGEEKNAIQLLVPFTLLSFNVLLSDAIVLWRMCVLSNQHRVARGISILLLVSTAVVSAKTVIRESSMVTVSSRGSGETLNFNDFPFGTAVLGLSLATNVVATAVIGWRAWRYRRDVSAYMAAFRHRSIVEKIMVLLVESGCVYCIIWVLYTIDSVGIRHVQETQPQDMGESLFGAGNPTWLSRIMPQLTGIYPTIIIVIVTLEQSYLERTITNTRLSAFVAARPVAPDPNSHSQSNLDSGRARTSWRSTHSVHPRTIDSAAGALPTIEEAEQVDGRSKVQPAEDQTECGSLHHVHAIVEPEDRTGVPERSDVQDSVHGDSLVRRHRRAQSAPYPSSWLVAPDEPRQPPQQVPLSIPRAPDAGWARQYDSWKALEGAEREGERNDASRTSDRRAPLSWSSSV
ncbi:unnamed protein product [Peniophora sp. CBMAI 1063]|nr:unnamed protein product [Peniophora sp. CBMAI 1063]